MIEGSILRGYWLINRCYFNKDTIDDRGEGLDCVLPDKRIFAIDLLDALDNKDLGKVNKFFNADLMDSCTIKFNQKIAILLRNLRARTLSLLSKTYKFSSNLYTSASFFILLRTEI